jgi:hypothetical protein
MKERKCPGMTLQETAMRQDVALFGLNSVGAVRLGGVGQGDLFDQVMAQLNGTD